MKNLIYLLVLSFTLSVNAQDFKEYYVVVKESKSIEPTSKTALPNGTLSMVFQDNQQHLQSFFDSKDVYLYEKAFPNNESSLLRRTYIVWVDSAVSLEQIENFPEIQAVGENPKPILLYDPNDYNTVPTNDITPVDYGYTTTSQSQLDLIRAPLAWEIRRGNNYSVVGMSDSAFNTNHEDLVGKIIANYAGFSNDLYAHGTMVAGCIAANTNNGIGISSVGHNTKIITAGIGDMQMDFLSQQPNVKVVNGSWYNRCTPDPTGVQQEVYNVIWNRCVLPVFAAGNGGQCGGNKLYPASYNHVLSVTSVGHIYDYGTPYGGPHDISIKDLHQIYRASTGLLWSHHHNDMVDICAPGYSVVSTMGDNYYSGGLNGTSFAAPIVAGAAALVYSQFPYFTAQQVYDILKETADDIYWIPENQPFIGQLGTGRLNVYRAVLTAKCMMGNSIADITDLMIKDSRLDVGNEPNENSSIFWESADIWVRNSNDGHLYQVHQNPEFTSGHPNYVYVRVTNRRCRTSSGGDRLYVNWAKAGTSLNWPENWDGSLSIGCVELGGLVGVGTIPPLKPGQEAIIEIPWIDMPNPDDFIGLSPEAYNFSLIARIESLDDPLSYPMVSNSYENVQKNNNLALKNIKILNFEPGIPNPIGGEVIVGNPTNQSKLYHLELVKETNEGGKAIFDEAEVNLKMDETLFNAWERGGKLAEALKNTDDETKKIVTGNNVLFKNILFEPNEFGVLNITFNFLTQELTDKENYRYRIIQRDANTNEIMGGQTFEIRKKTNQFFKANAGEDKTIDKFENITLNAETISDLHIYNWYDSDGNLIYTGKDLTISPEITQKYKLEIISTVDGFKDYDEIEVKVNPYSLHDLLPNPVSEQLNINYNALGANSAYLMLISSNNGTSDNYIINVSEENKQIDVSNYPTGLYFVSLICDGVLVDSKNVIIQ